jgi:hypothetical protein
MDTSLSTIGVGRMTVKASRHMIDSFLGEVCAGRGLWFLPVSRGGAQEDMWVCERRQHPTVTVGGPSLSTPWVLMAKEPTSVERQAPGSGLGWHVELGGCRQGKPLVVARGGTANPPPHFLVLSATTAVDTRTLWAHSLPPSPPPRFQAPLSHPPKNFLPTWTKVVAGRACLRYLACSFP